MDEKNEVNRLVEIVTGELRDHDKRITALELNDVKQDKDIGHVLKTLDRINDNTTWILRLIVGALVSGAIGLLFILARGS